MSLRTALLAATVLAAPFALSHAASAQPVTGLYIAGGGGYTFNNGTRDKSFHNSEGLDNPDAVHVTLHNGYTGEASIGYGLGNGLRVEIEGDYFENRFDKAKYGTSYVAGGKDQSYGAFVNALYDLDVGLPYLYPYIGAGVGYQEVKDNNAGADGFFVNKGHGAMAYQGIVGISYPIAPVPGLSATLEYRYTVFSGGHKYDGSIPGGSFQFKQGFDSVNSLQGGLRYAFGVAAPMAPAPAPAPMASPAPVPAKTYLVFFDWDKYNLTPRATQIIAQAASDSHTQATTTINVSGYTDTSGTPTYNQGLSERRAKAVAAQLVTDGVPSSEIAIHAYGQTHLLVATGPGVREPQNRRVEIVLQ